MLLTEVVGINQTVTEKTQVLLGYVERKERRGKGRVRVRLI